MRIIIIAVILAFTQSLHAQTVRTVVLSGLQSAAQRVDIVVPAGQLFKVLTWGGGGGQLEVDGVPVELARDNGGNIDYVVRSPSFVVAGPRTVSLILPRIEGWVLFCSYILTTNADISGPNVPSSSVVIPADATGPVQISLESSTDLVTWTDATPGSYGSSTSKRFFRVKAVTQ